jgi:hypothetical protein
MNGILLSENFELVINPVRDDNGLITQGIQIGNIDYQRVKMITMAQKGEFKEFPTLGFGIDNYLKANEKDVRQRFIVELTKELKSDGMNAKVTVGSKLSDFSVEI